MLGDDGGAGSLSPNSAPTSIPKCTKAIENAKYITGKLQNLLKTINIFGEKIAKQLKAMNTLPKK